MSRSARKPVDTLLDSLPRLTLAAGKGGVGKTTCAAALALRAAERGAATLLLSTDPAGTLGDVLGVPLGADPTRVPTDSDAALDAFQLDAAAERRQFLSRWRDTIVTIVDRGTYLDADDIAGLVDAAMPGADEVFAVLRLGDLERAAPYDRIFVDTAPTGHTLRLLDLPHTFAATLELLDAMQEKHRFMVRSLTHAYRADAADAFLAEMRDRVAGVAAALRDPVRSSALLVAREEPIVLAETGRYAAELTAAGIRVSGVIANAIGRDRALGALDCIPADAPRYTVPLLADTPVGVTGLRAWAAAVRKAPKTAAKPRSHGVPRKLSSSRPRRAAAVPDAQEALAASLTIVGGKGGVGKTTAACALAIVAAALTPPTLLVSTDPAPSVGDVLGQSIGDAETEVPAVPGLLARQMDATAGFREFQQTYQSRVDALFDTFVRRGVDAHQDRAILRDLLALAPPGIDELYALASLGETLDRGRFARVIVDPAPTGHLLRLLQMPALALEWSHRLMRLMLKYRGVANLGETAEELLGFARRTRAVGELLRDPARAALLVVALGEPLVRSETRRLVEAARAEGVSVRAVVWNRWPRGEVPPEPLPATPPLTQFVAPASTPPPIGAAALRAWAGAWSKLPESDV